MRFVISVIPESDFDKKDALIFAFKEDRLLVICNDIECRVPSRNEYAAMNQIALREHYLGVLDGSPCYSVELDPVNIKPANASYIGLRELFGMVDEEIFAIAFHAVQVVNWDRMHQFCGRCGSATDYAANERAKICTSCDARYYPRISPAVIAAISKGDKLLLMRNKRYKHDFYSVLAGFVEPGESLEECLMREAKEEVGITIKNISYFGSQPWPFPNSLMIGFTAEHATGDLVPDGEEISDAGWYSVEQFPNIPGSISIARKLIDHFIEKNR